VLGGAGRHLGEALGQVGGLVRRPGVLVGPDEALDGEGALGPAQRRGGGRRAGECGRRGRRDGGGRRRARGGDGGGGAAERLLVEPRVRKGVAQVGRAQQLGVGAPGLHGETLQHKYRICLIS